MEGFDCQIKGNPNQKSLPGLSSQQINKNAGQLFLLTRRLA
jgi:hypothetical protein